MRGHFWLFIAAAVSLFWALPTKKSEAGCSSPKIVSFWNYWTGTASDGTMLYKFEVIYTITGPTNVEISSFSESEIKFHDLHVDKTGTYTYQFDDDAGGAAPGTAYESVVVSSECSESQRAKAELLPPGDHPGPGAKPTATRQQPQVVVGMPFTGLWAYNVKVRPVNGRYSDATSSHPSVHDTPGHGDWATDLYAPVGEPVKLHVSSANGRLSFVLEPSSGCGGSVKIGVKVDGAEAGSLYVAHLASAITKGPVRNGMTLGYVADPKKDGNCNPGGHIHIELRNANSSTFACWTDHGIPGAALIPEGASLGVLGSSNTARRQACVSTKSKSSPGVQPEATPVRPKTTVADRWPINCKDRLASLLVYLGLRFRLPAWSSCDDRFCIIGNRGKVYVYLRHGTHYMQLGLPVGMKADPRTALINLGVPTADINRLLNR